MQTPKRFSFPPLRKVADLIHKGPMLLSHFVSESSEHYLFYWLEGDLLQNRWLVCRVRLEQLLKYTDRKISLHALLMAPSDGFLYKVETDNGTELQYQKIEIIFPKEVPKHQFPTRDSLYPGSPYTPPLDLMKLSSTYDSGLLQIHLSGSPKIGYGTIDMSLLAPVLHHLEEITTGLGNSYYKQQPADKATEKFARNDHKQLIVSASQYEIVQTLAGSFTLILRPRNQQLPLFGQEGEADKFSRYWHDFMEASLHFEKLKLFANTIEASVVLHYQNLLKLLKTTRIQMQIQWANHQSQLQWQHTLGQLEATTILENINRLEYLTDNTIRLTGRFTALNLRNNMYTFESADGKEKSKGYIATALHHAVSVIIFSRRYEVVIQRIEMKQAGKPKPRTKDLLIGFSEVNAPTRTLFRLDTGLNQGI